MIDKESIIKQYAGMTKDKEVKSTKLKRKDFKAKTIKAVTSVLKKGLPVSRKNLVEQSGVSISTVDDMTRNLSINGDIKKIVVPVGRTRITMYKWVK